MKAWALVLVIITALFSCKGEAPKKENKVNADSVKMTTVQWIDTVKEFGKINEGEILEVNFRVKNTGKEPLVFYNVSASCGCTVVEKPEEAVMPGDTTVIRARFDSKDRPGAAHKYLNVMCNTEQPNYTLIFEGEVIPKNKTTLDNPNNNFPKQPKSF